MKLLICLLVANIMLWITGRWWVFDVVYIELEVSSAYVFAHVSFMYVLEVALVILLLNVLRFLCFKNRTSLAYRVLANPAEINSVVLCTWMRAISALYGFGIELFTNYVVKNYDGETAKKLIFYCRILCSFQYYTRHLPPMFILT